jgi:uncharacterized repeat protein (TIGR03803 family)
VFPNGAIVLDAQGNLYGTTEYGGQYNEGILFEIAKGSNTLTTVLSLNNGQIPVGLTIDASGNLYAPAQSGRIVELVKGTSTLTVLASLKSTDQPASPLLLDAAGNLYGSTSRGGATNNGTIYELARGSGQVTYLASFGSAVDGGPRGALAMDSAGNIYGTSGTEIGTIFKWSKNSGTITDLASLIYGPRGGVTIDAAGDLYAAGGFSEQGTAVFEFVRGSNTLTSIATFQGPPNIGWAHVGPVTLDPAGNIYGITTSGYDQNLQGAVFELTPNTSVAVKLTSGTNPTNANDQLTYTATITGGVPDGETVLLEDASNGNAYVAAAVIVNGTATLTILPNTLSVGTHKLIVVYNGDGSHATSISTPLIQTILPAGFRPPRKV